MHTGGSHRAQMQEGQCPPPRLPGTGKLEGSSSVWPVCQGDLCFTAWAPESFLELSSAARPSVVTPATPATFELH